jgi:hypothetical protein
MDASARKDTSHGRIAAGAFRPHPLLANPHVQTLLPALLRPLPELELHVERWERPDGDFINLGWCGPESGRPQAAPPAPRHGCPLDIRERLRLALSRAAGEGRADGGAVGGVRAAEPGNEPRVILLHGLTGGFDSKYLRGLARALLALNWRVVIMEFRGAGPEPNRLPRYYHHGDTADLRGLIERLRREQPATVLFAVGWSLGGNVLLKYLGEEGMAAPLAGAVAVSVPFSLHECAGHLRQGFARVYQNKMLRELKHNLRRKAALMPMPIDVGRALAARDFFEYDNCATAPLNGFASAEDYYARCSNAQFLHAIRRPTLIVHAKDDPFMPPSIIPPARALSPQVTLELCERGGHVGFVAAGPRGAPAYWLEQRIPEFLKTVGRPVAAVTAA